MRALVGGSVVVLSFAVLGAVLARAGDRHDVLVLARRVDAGARLTAEDLREASFGSDDDVPSVPASAIDTVIGRYARTALAPGSMLRTESLQDRPLVSPGTVLMSVDVAARHIPNGLRVGSRLVLTVTSPADCHGDRAVVEVAATAAALPPVGSGDSALSRRLGLTLEVADDAGTVQLVGGAESVSIGLLASGVTVAPLMNPPAADTEPCPHSTGAPTGGIEGGSGAEPGAPAATGVTGLDASDVIVMAATTTVPG